MGGFYLFMRFDRLLLFKVDLRLNWFVVWTFLKGQTMVKETKFNSVGLKENK